MAKVLHNVWTPGWVDPGKFGSPRPSHQAEYVTRDVSNEHLYPGSISAAEMAALFWQVDEWEIGFDFDVAGTDSVTSNFPGKPGTPLDSHTYSLSHTGGTLSGEKTVNSGKGPVQTHSWSQSINSTWKHALWNLTNVGQTTWIADHDRQDSIEKRLEGRFDRYDSNQSSAPSLTASNQAYSPPRSGGEYSLAFGVSSLDLDVLFNLDSREPARSGSSWYPGFNLDLVAWTDNDLLEITWFTTTTKTKSPYAGAGFNFGDYYASLNPVATGFATLEDTLSNAFTLKIDGSTILQLPIYIFNDGLPSYSSVDISMTIDCTLL